MRIATGGITHETNTFGSILVTEEVFRNNRREGQDWIKSHVGVRSYNGGYWDEAQAQGIELVPAMHTGTGPSGMITKEALETSVNRLMERLLEVHREAPLDGIALTMHGAAVAEGCPDVEGRVLREIRSQFGREIPIGLVLDLHGNITEEMVELADVLVGVKGYPHVDEYDAARITMKLLADVIRTGKKPAMKLMKLPWMLSPAYGMTVPGRPAEDIRQKCLVLEQQDPELLQATFFHGFAYGDVPFASVSVVTVAQTQDAADRCAKAIADYAWSRREDFSVPALSAQEAVEQAISLGDGPVVINESSDNPGGGCPGDGTYLLGELLKRNVPGTAFGYIRDPEVVQQAISAGVGSYISCKLGGKTDKFHGQPLEIEKAYVKCISDGVFIKQSPMGAGAVQNIGPVARLEVGNVSIVVGTGRIQTMDAGPFACVGIDWREMRLLGLKSTQHFRGWWGSRAKGIVTADPPGIHCADLSCFPYQNANTDYYPLGNSRWEE